ncbi:hypothetical protein J7M28_10180 [bacterium]|nr:hypothetical protein [bacterium]
MAQGLFPIYNTAFDLAILVAAAAPGIVILARRRISSFVLISGVALSGLALVARFGLRALGLARWDGAEAISALCFAHLVAGVLSLALCFAIFSRRDVRIRAAMAIAFGFLFMLSAGIAAPDNLIDIRMRYAIGRAIALRSLMDGAIGRVSGSSGDLARNGSDDVVRWLSRQGLLIVPRMQLDSLSQRFFASRFADDARLVAELLLGSESRDATLSRLEPQLLSRRLDFTLEPFTVRKLLRWPHLFGSERLSNQMFLTIAEQRTAGGQLAEAESALSPVLLSGRAVCGAEALGMLQHIYFDSLSDYEGGLMAIGRVLSAVPEYALLPEARTVWGALDASSMERLAIISTENENPRVRALAQLRLYLFARSSGRDSQASEMLVSLMQLCPGDFGTLVFGLRLHHLALASQGETALQLCMTAVELCDGLEAPLLILASELDASEVFPELPEIALRRLVSTGQKSLSWRRGFCELAALLEREGRRTELLSLLLEHQDRLDLLGEDDLSRMARAALDADGER